MTDVIVVLVTAKDEEEAARIAKALVTKKFAACCNIVPAARSIYIWDGVLQDGREALMIVKTRKSLFAALEAEIKALHSYSTPEIMAIPVAAGSKSYLDWVKSATT